MRKSNVLLQFFFIVQSAVCVAQQDKIIDSLLSVLENQKRDTNKVRTLLAMASRYLSMNPNYSPSRALQSQKFGEEALILAQQLNFQVGVADSYDFIAHTHRQNYAEALKNYNLSLNVRKEMGDKGGVSKSYWFIGQAHALRGNFNESLNSFSASLKIAEEICDNLRIYSCHVTMGVTYSRQDNYPEALKSYIAALKCAEKMNDKRRVANSHRRIGDFFKEQGNLAQALKYYFAYIKKSEELGDNVTDQYNLLGQIYDLQGNYPEALKYFQAALIASDETGNYQMTNGMYLAIASIHGKQSNFNEALKNYRLQLEICEKKGDKTAIAATYRYIGQAYMSWARRINRKDSMVYRDQLYSKALENYQVSLKISEEAGNKQGMSLAYAFIANAYHEQKDLPAALKNYLDAIEIDNEFIHNDFAYGYYMDISEIYTELKKFSEARQFLNNALSVFKKSGDKRKIANCYDHLTSVDIASGNWEGAYQNYKMFILYRDSIDNKVNTEKIIRLQMQNEFEKREDSLLFQQLLTDEKLKQQILTVENQEQALLLKEKELALISGERNIQQLLLEKNHADLATQKAVTERKQSELEVLDKQREIQTIELKKQRQLKTYLWIGLVLLSILSILAYWNYRNRQQVKVQSLRNKIAIDLHDDIGSTLSSISIFSQMAQKQSKETIPLLETIGENSRKMLDAMADIVWTINPENDQFEKIVLRMRNFAYELLGAKNIDFEFNADEEVTKMKLAMNVRKNLYLIFKEATNNLVKYSGAKKATFNIKVEKNNLTMLISDNGQGFDQQQITGGNGLKNMRTRAEEIKGELMIHSVPENGTTIELKIAV